MIRRPFHTLLIFAFALLQCVAPLVHAHVDGQQSGILPPTLTAQPQASDNLALAGCVIEVNESTAIGLQSEWQRDEQPAITQPSWINTFSARPVATAQFLSPAALPHRAPLTYHTPQPQAPPALG